MDRADEIAREVAQIGFKAVHLTEMPADDPGGCEGCEKGWCQSAVDAICDGRSQFQQAVIPAIAAALRDFAKEGGSPEADQLEAVRILLSLAQGENVVAALNRLIQENDHLRGQLRAAKIREDGKEKP